MKCERCGKQARQVVAVDNGGPEMMSPFRNPAAVLPRAALTPEQDEAIPWGEHPDDNRFGTICLPCAEKAVWSDP